MRHFEEQFKREVSTPIYHEAESWKQYAQWLEARLVKHEPDTLWFKQAMAKASNILQSYHGQFGMTVTTTQNSDKEPCNESIYEDFPRRNR